jgi:hypothetical protein
MATVVGMTGRELAMTTRVQGDYTSFCSAGKLAQGRGGGSSYTVPLDLRSFFILRRRARQRMERTVIYRCEYVDGSVRNENAVSQSRIERGHFERTWEEVRVRER